MSVTNNSPIVTMGKSIIHKVPKQVGWITLPLVVTLALISPTPGDYFTLAGSEHSAICLLTSVFWIGLFARFVWSKSFANEELWAVRIGMIIIYGLISFIAALLLRFAVIRLYCLVATTQTISQVGWVTDVRKSGKGNPAQYQIKYTTSAGAQHIYWSKKSVRVGERLILDMHITDSGISFGNASKAK